MMEPILDRAQIALQNQRYTLPPLASSGAVAFSQRPIDKGSALYKSAQDFEAIFIKQMLDTMRKTVDRAGLIERGPGEEIFEDMLYDKYSQKMSQSAGFGLADTLYRQLAYLQELPKAEL